MKPNYNNSIPKKLFKGNNGFRILTYNVLIQKLKQISEFEYIEKDNFIEYINKRLTIEENEEMKFNIASVLKSINLIIKSQK